MFGFKLICGSFDWMLQRYWSVEKVRHPLFSICIVISQFSYKWSGSHIRRDNYTTMYFFLEDSQEKLPLSRNFRAYLLNIYITVRILSVIGYFYISHKRRKKNTQGTQTPSAKVFANFSARVFNAARILPQI